MATPDAFDTVRCPTCRAAQEWSDTCRRCKSDLRLLRDCAEAYRRARRDCLRALRHSQAGVARRAAQECAALRPDAESRRLLALAALLGGDWTTAAALAGATQDLSGLEIPNDK